MIPDISISKRPPRNVSAAYYAGISMRYGFADSVMRGHGANLIPVKPTGDYVEHGLPDSYVVDGRPGRPNTVRDRDFDAAKRAQARSNEATDLLRQLRDLHEHLRDRVANRPSIAIRDAMIDVESILRGGDPIAMGCGRLDVMRSLVRVLARHA